MRNESGHGELLAEHALLRVDVQDHPHPEMAGEPWYQVQSYEPDRSGGSAWQDVVATTELSRLDLWAQLDHAHQQTHGPPLRQAADRLEDVRAGVEQRETFTATLVARSPGRDVYEVETFVQDTWQAARAARDDRSAEQWLTGTLPDDLRRSLDPSGQDRALVARTAAAARAERPLTRALSAIRVPADQTRGASIGRAR